MKRGTARAGLIVRDELKAVAISGQAHFGGPNNQFTTKCGAKRGCVFNEWRSYLAGKSNDLDYRSRILRQGSLKLLLIKLKILDVGLDRLPGPCLVFVSRS